MSEWSDNDAFWADVTPVIFTRERVEQAVEEVEHIIKLVDPAPKSAVLDLGCGVGRHAIPFAKRGFRVTGVDRTARYLECAQKTATEQRLDIEWHQADMRQFRREAAFDVTVSLLTSFGYFEDPGDDRRILANIAASLKPGGRFVMDIMGKEILARIFRERDWQELPGGTVLLEERKVADDWSRLVMRWLVIREGVTRDHRFFLRLYSAAELVSMFCDVGFATVTTYGSFKGAPYDHQAERLILVAAKG